MNQHAYREVEEITFDSTLVSRILGLLLRWLTTYSFCWDSVARATIAYKRSVLVPGAHAEMTQVALRRIQHLNRAKPL